MPYQSKIAFTKRGSGETLILFHGYGGSVLHWNKIADTLSEKYEIVLPNLTHLYMGNEELTFSQQVETLANWIERNFSGKKVHVAGISYGAAIAWALAYQCSQIVKRVALINPMPPSPINEINVPIVKQVMKMPLNMRSLYLILRTPLGRFFLKRISQVFRAERAGFWDRVDDLHGRKLLFVCRVILRFSWILKNEDWARWKKLIEQQKLKNTFCLMYDPEDSLFTSKTYAGFSDLIGVTDAHQLTDAGHLAIVTQPQEVSDVLEGFLKQKSGLKSA